MNEQLVMGIDPSTHTGICIADFSGKVIHTREVSAPAGKAGFERISYLMADVLDAYQTFKPSHVVIEGMIVGHASSAVVVIQVATILRYFLWQEGIDYLEVPVGTLKKFVCGIGNAKKEQMMMWVSKRFGYESATNNIADAVGLAMFGVCAYSPAKFGTPDQRLIVKKLLTPPLKSRSK